MKRGIILLACVLLIGVLPSAAQEATPEAAPPISPELSAQMDQLVAWTEYLRGLTTIAPVERAFPTRDQTIAYMTRSYDQSFPPDQVARQQAFYVALGMLPAGTDLRSVYLSLLGSQVAGFYDPATQIMNVLPIGFSSATSLSISEQIIFIHEYTHALQDQHFHLEAVQNAANPTNNPDQSLAVTALIEGDATATMAVYEQQVMMQNPAASLMMLAEQLQSGNLTLPQGIPSGLVNELLFPYGAGLTFVSALLDAGGWNAVNQAYALDHLRQTTEQVMHPNSYLAGDTAQTINTVDLSTVLTGWTTLYDISLGEFYVGEHLKSLGGNPITAAGAAAGWGGDRFQLLQDPNSGDLAWALVIGWDTPNDQREFEAVYRGLDATWGAADAQGCWTRTGEIRCEFARGSQSVVVSAPTNALADQIRAAVGAS